VSYALVTAKDLVCAEFIPSPVSKNYERHDEISEFAAGLRYSVKALSSGFLLGSAFTTQPSDAILAGVGCYLAADLVYQTGYELKNYMKGNHRLDVCEQPATLAIEVSYKVGNHLWKRIREYIDGDETL
jgi:hypothetical protein